MTPDRETARKLIKEMKTDDYKKVFSYLNRRPLATITEVKESTGVSSATILSYVHAGMLKIRNSN